MERGNDNKGIRAKLSDGVEDTAMEGFMEGRGGN